MHGAWWVKKRTLVKCLWKMFLLYCKIWVHSSKVKSQKKQSFKKREWKICLPVLGVSRKPSISPIINRKFPKFNCPLDYELQKQPPEAFYEKKVFLEILQNSQESTCLRGQSLFFNKLAGISVNFAKVLKDTFFAEHLLWLTASRNISMRKS